jgi:hypothetical protein
MIQVQGSQKDLQALLGRPAHDKLMLNAQLALTLRGISQMNPEAQQATEYVVARSTHRVYALNICETVDWNVETVLRAQGCPDTQVKALVEHYTFRIIIDGQVFDARDTFEVLELSRT